MVAPKKTITMIAARGPRHTLCSLFKREFNYSICEKAASREGLLRVDTGLASLFETQATTGHFETFGGHECPPLSRRSWRTVRFQ